jgi:hypothetical protein
MTLEEIGSMLKREVSLREINSFWHLQLQGVAAHVPEAPAAKKNELHEETIAEIREECPDADEREVELRIAIRESFGATRTEEDAAYERISGALQS